MDYETGKLLEQILADIEVVKQTLIKAGLLKLEDKK